MLIAFDSVNGVVVTGPESQSNIESRYQKPHKNTLTDGGVITQHLITPQSTPNCNIRRKNSGNACHNNGKPRYECVVCNKPLIKNNVQNKKAKQVEDIFDWFEHTNGDPDCFGDGSMGASHRAAVELSAHRLARASHQLHAGCNSPEQAGSYPRIKPEKRVTAPENNHWIQTDVHLNTPRVAVEVFSKVSQLDLRRRLTVLFDAGYDVYIVFDVDGRYDPNQIEMWLQDVATVPIQIGRFDKSHMVSSDMPPLTLGTRFSKSVIDPGELIDAAVPLFVQ